MKPSSSRLLKKLGQGLVPGILKLNLSDPRVLELAALAGADAVWLCNEHVGNDWLSLENQIRAARIYGMDTIVRVCRGSYSDYIRPLEAGATGIMVPHVTTAEDARQIVNWVRFQPLGNRPLDGGNVDGLFGMLPIEEYIHHSNTERMLILQIESPEGLENVDEIAAVPGYDMILFGSGDFSHRIGKPDLIDDPEVVAARQKVAATAKKHGKYVMSAGLVAPLSQLIEEGHDAFSVGSDVFGLGAYFRESLADLDPTIASPALSHFKA